MSDPPRAEVAWWRLRRRIIEAGVWMDRSWGWTAAALALVVTGGWLVFDWAMDRSQPLLSVVAGADRATLYGTVAATSAALLGFAITSVAVLASLSPDRPQVRKLIEYDAVEPVCRWLLGASVFLGVAVVAAIIGIAIDTTDRTHVSLATTTVAIQAVLVWSGVGAGVMLVASGTALGQVVRRTLRPSPTGEGTAGIPRAQ